MFLSLEISRKGEASGMGMFLQDGMVPGCFAHQPLAYNIKKYWFGVL